MSEHESDAEAPGESAPAEDSDGGANDDAGRTQVEDAGGATALDAETARLPETDSATMLEDAGHAANDDASATTMSDAGDSASQDASAEHDAATHDPDATLPVTALPVWRSTSVRLELSTFSFWGGSMGYDIVREQMSPAQLAALEGLREIPTPPGPPVYDVGSYRLRISDSSGEVIEYRAAPNNFIDGDERLTSGARSLDYASLTPFLGTFHCLTAKQAPLTGSQDPIALAATFDTDPSCRHGVFVTWGTSHSYRKWRIDEVGTYRLIVTRCFQQMRLRLFDATGQQELAASAQATAPSCPELAYTFDTPGVYVVDLEKSGNPLATNDSAGDATMRVLRD